MAAIFALVSMFFGYFLMYRHRKSTDICIQKCGGNSGNKCYYQCYVNITQSYIKQLNNNLSELRSNNQFTEPQKEALTNKIQKRILYFNIKLKKFEHNLSNSDN